MEKSNLSLAPRLVSYSAGVYKAVSVPAVGSVLIEDISQWKTGDAALGRTEARLWHDASSLYLEVSCFEPEAALIQSNNKSDGMRVWDGDMIEIFFGAVEPVPWLLQLAVGAGGGRFDSRGQYDLWEAKTCTDSLGWHARIRLPMRFLRLNNLSTGFNICRQSVVRQEVSSWASLVKQFHEAESFGELLFCDYETAFFAKTGCPSNKKLTRSTFEAEISSRLLPSESVVHGPYLSNPAPNGMSVSWATAGMSGAIIEYRKQGTEEWLSQVVGPQNGVLCRNSAMHVAHLSGLEENSLYEYRLLNWSALLKRRNLTPEQKTFSFQTLSAGSKEYSFAACSDIHSDSHILRKLMQLPLVQQTDFFVNLGDMLSCMAGADSLFDGFLDLQSELYAKEKPLLFVRGNHEQIGVFAADYYLLMSHPSGKTYYAFRHGEVCFLALDVGNDHPDDANGIYQNSAMIAEERKWLEDIVASDLFKGATFRVAFLHIPPYNDEYDSRAAMSLLDGVFTAAPLHLLISGHVHQYFRIEPFSGKCSSAKAKPDMKNTPTLPFAVVVNDTNTVVWVKVAEQKLSIKVIDADGDIVDEFVILPDTRLIGGKIFEKIL